MQSSERTAVEVSALKAPAAPGLRSPSALLRLQSDERLIALIRRGQHAAFETLFSRYQSRLLSFCRHMLGSKEDAEDVLQEVFAAAFNAILADEREINVRPWLYRIARNRSLNHLRKASAIGVDSMDVHFADNGVSTADKVMRRESFRQLIGDVQELPETQRTALLLREIDALSYEQISDAMETTVPAVKSLLVRARISLAEAAEARKLTCDEARMELGEVAEGLVKSSPAVRRHVRDCERCRAFRKQLKDNNVALAAIMPVGPLLMLKKLVLTKLGSTAGAGGAHAAGAGGAGAAAAGASAAGGASATGSFVTAGVGALATKAAAGLAVAAIVTAGTVAADHSTTTSRRHHHALAAAAALPVVHASEPVITRSSAQPVTASSPGLPVDRTAALARRHRLKRLKKGPVPTDATPTTVATVIPASTVVSTTTAQATAPKPTPPVTEVTTDSTQLPSAQVPSATPAPAPVTPTETTATTPPSTEETTTTPPPTTTTTPPTSTSPPPSEETDGSPTVPNVEVSLPQPVTQTPDAQTPDAKTSTDSDGE
ncbi:MAG TPA: sigma-70 family RNA polymerase sigma factor [Solirubrobacteraceae bacterium]